MTGRSHQSCVRCPKTTPIRRTCSMRSRHGTRPMTSQLPASGTRMPASSFTVVDLPAPFGPMYPTISPRSMARSMPRSAWTVLCRRATTPASAPRRPGRRTATRKLFARPRATICTTTSFRGARILTRAARLASRCRPAAGWRSPARAEAGLVVVRLAGLPNVAVDVALDGDAAVPQAVGAEARHGDVHVELCGRAGPDGRCADVGASPVAPHDPGRAGRGGGGPLVLHTHDQLPPRVSGAIRRLPLLWLEIRRGATPAGRARARRRVAAAG